MGERKGEWPNALRGAASGAAAGLVVALIYYLYEEVTNPNWYNALMLIEMAPVAATLGAIVGLLAWAWYSSD